MSAPAGATAGETAVRSYASRRQWNRLNPRARERAQDQIVRRALLLRRRRRRMNVDHGPVHVHRLGSISHNRHRFRIGYGDVE